MDDMTEYPPRSGSLRARYWRSEILEVVFWLRGEGFGDELDPKLLERILGVDADVGRIYLQRLVDEGILVETDGRFRLSEIGAAKGVRTFLSSLSELTVATHDDCGADCWCRNSPEASDALGMARP